MARNYPFKVEWYHGQQDFVVVTPLRDVSGDQFSTLREYLDKRLPLTILEGHIASFALDERVKGDEMIGKVLGTALSYIDSDLMGSHSKLRPRMEYEVIAEGNHTNNRGGAPRSTRAKETNRIKRIAS